MRNFWELQEKGDTDGLIQLHSKRMIEKAVNEAGGITKLKDTFESENKLHSITKEAGGIRSIESLHEDIAGDIAEVIVMITLKGQTKKDGFKHKLVKEDGVWKLDESGLY